MVAAIKNFFFQRAGGSGKTVGQLFVFVLQSLFQGAEGPTDVGAEPDSIHQHPACMWKKFQEHFLRNLNY